MESYSKLSRHKRPYDYAMHDTEPSPSSIKKKIKFYSAIEPTLEPEPLVTAHIPLAESTTG